MIESSRNYNTQNSNQPDASASRSARARPLSTGFGDAKASFLDTLFAQTKIRPTTSSSKSSGFLAACNDCSPQPESVDERKSSDVKPPIEERSDEVQQDANLDEHPIIVDSFLPYIKPPETGERVDFPNVESNQPLDSATIVAASQTTSSEPDFAAEATEVLASQNLAIEAAPETESATENVVPVETQTVSLPTTNESSVIQAVAAVAGNDSAYALPSEIVIDDQIATAYVLPESIQPPDEQVQSVAPEQNVALEQNVDAKEEQPTTVHSNNDGSKVKVAQASAPTANPDPDQPKDSNRRSQQLEQNRREVRFDSDGANTGSKSSVTAASQTQVVNAATERSNVVQHAAATQAFDVHSTNDSTSVQSFVTQPTSTSLVPSAAIQVTATTASIQVATNFATKPSAGSNASAANLNDGLVGITAPQRFQQASNPTAATGPIGGLQDSEATLTSYQQNRVLQRVLNGLERLDDGSSIVRIRLHPPELGALEISLNMKQQTLQASIITDTDAAREVLQQNLPQLQAKLAEQGIKVEKFELQTQTQDLTRQQHQNFAQTSDSQSESKNRSFADLQAQALRRSLNAKRQSNRSQPLAATSAFAAPTTQFDTRF